MIKEHHPLWGNLSLSEIISFWLIAKSFIVMVAVFWVPVNFVLASININHSLMVMHLSLLYKKEKKKVKRNMYLPSVITHLHFNVCVLEYIVCMAKINNLLFSISQYKSSQ